MKRFLIALPVLLVLSLLALPLLVRHLVAAQQQGVLQQLSERFPELHWQPDQSHRGYGDSAFVWQRDGQDIARHEVRHGPLLLGPGRGWAAGELLLEPPLVARSSRIRWRLGLGLELEIQADLAALAWPEQPQRFSADALDLRLFRVEGARKLRLQAARLAIGELELAEVALTAVAERPGRRALELQLSRLSLEAGLIVDGLRLGLEYQPSSDPIQVSADLAGEQLRLGAETYGPMLAELKVEQLPQESLARISESLARDDPDSDRQARLIGALIAELPLWASRGTRLHLSPLQLQTEEGRTGGELALRLAMPATPVLGPAWFRAAVQGEAVVQLPRPLSQGLVALVLGGEGPLERRLRDAEAWLQQEGLASGLIREVPGGYALAVRLREGQLLADPERS